MFLLKKLMAAWLLPPMGLVILGFVGLIICSGKRRTLGKGLVILSLAGLAVLSIPLVAETLAELVAIYPPIQPAQLRQAQAIVILGGGIHSNAPEYGQTATISLPTLGRVRYGAYLAKRSGLPILVSGGSALGNDAEAPLMAAALSREFGLTPVWIEDQSRDTQENAQYSSATLNRSHVTKIVLVSQAFHLRRAVGLFQKQGIEVFPAPTLPPGHSDGIAAWLPSAGNLDLSCTALRELVGLAVSHAR